MGEFFLILIGYFVFLLMNYKKANDINNENKFYRDDSREYAIRFNKPVWFEGYKKDQKNYLETRSNRKVFKGIDKNGLKRWYYLDTKHPMQYVEDKRIFESFKRNKTTALANGEKWCVAENFWDDSIISLDNSKPISSTYLDDYRERGDFLREIEWNKYVNEWNKKNPSKISKNRISIGREVTIYLNSTPEIKAKYKEYFYNNNPLNQKVYLKNMRPYQLYLIGTSGTNFQHDPFIKKQYLIRFGNLDYFNFKTQHCISDKQLSSKNCFWTKWYAITEEEYFSLIQTDKGLPNNVYSSKFDTLFSLKKLKPINVNDIAFVEGNESVKWELENCGIKKAFDNEGNFIDE